MSSRMKACIASACLAVAMATSVVALLEAFHEGYQEGAEMTLYMAFIWGPLGIIFRILIDVFKEKDKEQEDNTKH